MADNNDVTNVESSDGVIGVMRQADITAGNSRIAAIVNNMHSRQASSKGTGRY